MRQIAVCMGIISLLILPACSAVRNIPPYLGFLGTDTATPTLTPSPTATFTPTLTFTATFTPTVTFTFTSTNTLTPTFTATDTPRPYVPAAASYADQVISMVNAERAWNGLSALSVNYSLMSNSQEWSNYMANNNVFYHSGQNVAENIAAGYESPSVAVARWMASEGHRANILNPAYTQVGAGYAYNSNSSYGHYWTLQLLP